MNRNLQNDLDEKDRKMEEEEAKRKFSRFSQISPDKDFEKKRKQHYDEGKVLKDLMKYLFSDRSLIQLRKKFAEEEEDG